MPEKSTVVEVQHTLEEPFEYAHRGEQVTAEFVILKAPTSRHSKECAVLRQAFYVASLQYAERVGGGVEKEVKEAEGADLSPSEVLDFISACPDVDLGKVFEVSKKLFVSGLALLDGEERVTTGLMDKLSQADFEAMVGKYLRNFTLASSLGPTRES